MAAANEGVLPDMSSKVSDMGTDRAKLAELLQQAGLGDYVEAVLQYAQPCIRLHARPADDPDALPLGASRIGGLPDLPPNVQWPARNGRPCEFIAQINLREASPYDETGLLPKEGVLLFFYDGRDYEVHPVNLTRRALRRLSTTRAHSLTGTSHRLPQFAR